jgi:hypothetical protein
MAFSRSSVTSNNSYEKRGKIFGLFLNLRQVKEFKRPIVTR